MYLIFLLLIALLLNANGEANPPFYSHRILARDDRSSNQLFRSSLNDKVLLKNKLLDSLNSFFPSHGESLEMLISENNPEDEFKDSNSLSEMSPVRKPVNAPPIKFGVTQQCQGEVNIDCENQPMQTFREQSVNIFPTLIPTEASLPPLVEQSVAPRFQMVNDAPKNRSDEVAMSEKTIQNIRDWRKRLYKVFKSKARPSVVRIIDNSRTNNAKEIDTSEVLQFNDLTPIVVDKNRQVLLSRKEPNWQNIMAGKETFGKDPQGKLVRLFGLETSGYLPEKQSESIPGQIPLSYLPMPTLPYSRTSYRIENRQQNVFVPAPPFYPGSQSTMASVHLVTATVPSQGNISPVLPSMFPQLSEHTLIYSSVPSYNNQQNYNKYSANEQSPNHIAPPKFNMVSQYTTQPPPNYYNMGGTPPTRMEQFVEDSDLQEDENESRDRIFGPPQKEVSSHNIISNDAEASKKAVQSAAEDETGQYFNAVCGTGFFSYIGKNNIIKAFSLTYN
uniref:WD_REPEATS_REGION domain-containing protein n=1 Tax=Heterorhabditis bacteriophora TaxID=37862 RepID=A0A1I7XV84_HETBA